MIPALAAQAWHEEEHDTIARLAVRLLPDSVPQFFRESESAIAHISIDPDLFAERSLPELRHTERPEHYIDLELLGGRPLPPRREDMLRLIFELELDTHKVGLLPYAIVEWTQRLTMAFAEHRKWPDDPIIRAKAAIYAGILSHYAADLTMPLHTTVHFDGRMNEDGTSPRTGIHFRVDGLLRKLGEPEAAWVADIRPVAYEELFPAIVRELMISHGKVDRVYELEARIPQRDEMEIKCPEVRELAMGCLRHAVRFNSELFLTAWVNSERVEVPRWLNRPAIAERAARRAGQNEQPSSGEAAAEAEEGASGQETEE